MKADHLPPDLLPVCDATTSPDRLQRAAQPPLRASRKTGGAVVHEGAVLETRTMSKASRGGGPRPSCCCNIRPAETHLMALGVDPGNFRALPTRIWSGVRPRCRMALSGDANPGPAWPALINRLFLGQGALSMSVIEPKRERDARRSVPAWMPLGLKVDTDLYDDC